MYLSTAAVTAVTIMSLLGTSTALFRPYNTQSCTAEDGALSAVYFKLEVEVDYVDGKCDEAYNRVSSAIVISDWLCDRSTSSEPEEHSYYISFTGTSPVHNDHLNQALHDTFPTVNGFNCPGY